MEDVVLSKKHVREQPQFKKLNPGDTIKRQLDWNPRNAREKSAHVRELAAKITLTRTLPEETGAEFARVFGSGPLSCTREVRVNVGDVVGP